MAKSFTLDELARLTRTRFIGDGKKQVSNVDALDSATENDVSFLANPRYRAAMEKSQAGVICISPDIAMIEGKNFLVSDHPSSTFQAIAELILEKKKSMTAFVGIHQNVTIHPSAQLGQNVSIGPYTTIDQGVSIGDNTAISAGVHIGPNVQIGADCILYSGVVIRESCFIGNRVILQPNAVIGSCGFGYITDQKGEHKKLEQLGTVIVEDDVEIGACTTIDRARFKSTIIKKGTKIDNLVQIGHNVVLGEHNIIVSQSGIAGSSKTGRNVVLGGQAGIVGHVEVSDFTMIATRGGVSKSIEKGGKYAGGPVMPLAEHNRLQVQLRNLPATLKRIEELEKKLELLEKLLQTSCAADL